jgi:hypothetical protein
MADQPTSKTPAENWREMEEFFSMRTLLTGKLIRTTYTVGQVLIVLGILQWLRMGFASFLIGVTLGVFASIVWRVACEFVVVVFSIHDELVGLRKDTQARSLRPAP